MITHKTGHGHRVAVDCLGHRVVGHDKTCRIDYELGGLFLVLGELGGADVWYRRYLVTEGGGGHPANTVESHTTHQVRLLGRRRADHDGMFVRVSISDPLRN
jgi:hypothetical protein